MEKSMKVQAFYNVTFNLIHGESKFAWGFSVFDLSENASLPEQLLELIHYPNNQILNLNLKAFTPIDTVNFAKSAFKRTHSHHKLDDMHTFYVAKGHVDDAMLGSGDE